MHVVAMINKLIAFFLGATDYLINEIIGDALKRYQYLRGTGMRACCCSQVSSGIGGTRGGAAVAPECLDRDYILGNLLVADDYGERGTACIGTFHLRLKA